MIIKFRVVGIPKPHSIGAKSVPGKYGKPIGRVYDSAVARDWKRTVAAAAQIVRPEHLIKTKVPITLSLTFFMPMRQDFSKKKVAAIHAGETLYHTVRPDRTALLRSTEDALTGVIWRDDAQVCAGPIYKIYGDPPGVEIVIGYEEEGR